MRRPRQASINIPVSSPWPLCTACALPASWIHRDLLSHSALYIFRCTKYYYIAFEPGQSQLTFWTTQMFPDFPIIKITKKGYKKLLCAAIKLLYNLNPPKLYKENRLRVQQQRNLLRWLYLQGAVNENTFSSNEHPLIRVISLWVKWLAAPVDVKFCGNDYGLVNRKGGCFRLPAWNVNIYTIRNHEQKLVSKYVPFVTM